MSHTTTIKAIKITSIDALRIAVNELKSQGIKCELAENVKPRSYSANQQGMGVAPYVLRIPDANYDVGFYQTDDGSYEARTDFFLGSVAKVLGVPAADRERAEQAQLGKLYQAYGIAVVEEQARRQGHSVRRIPQADGGVKLTITGAFA